MSSTLGIGDFARATFLSVKTLRHYHKVGLLEPAEVDPRTGYRSYDVEQIATAHLIRRFRDIDMPLEHIREVLSASDVETRSQLLQAHLARLEVSLARTQQAVTSLRQVLEGPPSSLEIEHRHLAATPAAVVTDTVDLVDALGWAHGALGELAATLASQDIESTGIAGGIFDTDLYAHERGTATVFVACDALPRPVGRVSTAVVPAVDLATIVHEGSHADIDRAYGALADHVTRHAIGLDGPIREHYLVGPADTADQAEWRTEIGWPIFPATPPHRAGTTGEGVRLQR